MTVKNVLLTATKSIAFDQYPEEAWKTLSGGDDGNLAAAYFRSVSWLYRAVEIRSQAVASMPFTIYRGETEFDTSDDWQNKVGFLPNPAELFALIEACLTLEPQCYLFSDNAGQIRKRLRYILPNSAEPVIDPVRGLTTFRRNVAGGVREFIPGVDIVYFWRGDPYTEQGAGPGKSSPGRAALLAAGVLTNIDRFLSGYFEHGAVKATILSVKGNPSREEREKLESWWQRFMTGVRRASNAKVLNADAVTPTIIGEGLEGLQNKELTQERREDIATALGVPHSLLFSNAANFATAQQDDLHFYSKTIVPECNFIAGVLNEQVFAPLGLRLDFRPETLDAFQEDERERAGALSQLTSAGIPLLMAMDILGFELTAEQRAELERLEAEKETRAEALTANLTQQKPVTDNQAEETPASETPVSETPAQADVRRWMTKALKAIKRGETAAVPFESEAIAEDDQMRIRAALEDCKTADEVRAAFVTMRVDPLALLAGELRAARLLLESEHADG